MSSISNISEADANLLKASVGYAQMNLSENYTYKPKTEYITINYGREVRYRCCYHNDSADAIFAGLVLGSMLRPHHHHHFGGGHGLGSHSFRPHSGAGCNDCCKGADCKDAGAGILLALLIGAVVIVASTSLIVGGVSIALGVSAEEKRAKMNEGKKITDTIDRNTNQEVARDVNNLVKAVKAVHKPEYASRVSYAVFTGIAAVGLAVATATIAIAGLAALKKISPPGFNLWLLGIPAISITAAGALGLCITPCAHAAASESKERKLEEIDRLKFEMINKYKGDVFTEEFLKRVRLVEEIPAQ